MLVEANGQGCFLKKDQQLREITLSTRGTLLCLWIFALTTGRAPAKPLGSRASSVPLTLWLCRPARPDDVYDYVVGKGEFVPQPAILLY